MNIALVLEHFDSQGGGLERWAWQLSHALGRRGHRVSVIAFEPARSPAEGGAIDGGEGGGRVEVRLLPWRESRLARAHAMEAAVSGIRADVVHDLGVGWSADLLQPQMGCRLANHRRELRSFSARQRVFHAIHPRKRRWLDEVRRLEQRQYQRSSCLIGAVSHMVARDLSEFHSVQPERIRLIPNGVDTGRFSPAPAAKREYHRGRLGITSNTVFLFAAHNPRLKGIGPLLKSFSASVLKRPDLRLVVLGREPVPESLRFVRAERLEHAVIFGGLVHDMGPWLAASDAFVLPSYYDACSLVILEACASGLPVITTRHNGAAELLTDGREGRLIQHADDTEALARALIELADPEVRARMSLDALELTSRCSFERNVDEVERVYAEAAQRRPGGGGTNA
jgi:UDP-glucose:(heptosyl)LPS alpha-1,3-glucosyltransferase